MEGFIATMPAVYERLYSTSDMAEHAAIASRRRGHLVHAEVWQSPKGPLLCLVGEDRPGFLALVTDALLTQGLAIRSARAFCREVGKDSLEAIDLLELYALGGPNEVLTRLDGEVLATFVQTLTEVITDDDEQRKTPGVASVPPSARRPATRVYFEREPPAEGRYLLVVDAPDADGLLHAISSVLDERGMRIMACEIRTVDGRACNRFEVEPVSPRFLNDGELCDVQLAVFDALPSRP